MKIESLKRAIIKAGGTAEIRTETLKNWQGVERQERTLVGILNNHDVTMHDNCGFFTSRAIEDRGYYDPGSDYNPSGYTFHRRVKDIDWIKNYK